MPEAATSSTSSEPTTTTMLSTSTPLWVWLSVIAVILADQASKFVALKIMSVGAPIAAIPGCLSLVLTFNKGAAFSFLAASGGWQRYLFTLVAICTSVWLIQELRKPSPLLQRWGTLLVLGGAIGNLCDRLLYGHVVDFIFVYWRHYWSFSVFNVADIAITIGVGLMLLSLWLHGHGQPSTDSHC